MASYRAISLFVLAVITSITPAAAAEPVDETTRAAARKLGNSGVEAYQAGDFVGAHEKLDKAFRALRAPSLGLWSARALVKLGKLVEAAERYVEVTRLPTSSGDEAVQQQARSDAQLELDALTPRIPSVVIVLEGADASSSSITIDGKLIAAALLGEACPVNPGSHRIEGRRGSEIVHADITLAEGDTQNVPVRFQDAAGAPSVGARARPVPGDAPRGRGSKRTLGWVALGAGGVGVAVGGVAAVLALGKRSDILDNPQCGSDGCPPSERDAAESLDTMRTTSTVGFIAGGALVGAGIVLLVISGPADQPRVGAFLSPNGAGLRGRF